MTATKHDGKKLPYELIPYHHWPRGSIARDIAEWFQTGKKFPVWPGDIGTNTAPVAKIMQFGAEKYDPWNWREGFKWGRIVGALLRHWEHIGENDPESGLDHAYHSYVNYLFLRSHVECELGKDDRPCT